MSTWVSAKPILEISVLSVFSWRSVPRWTSWPRRKKPSWSSSRPSSRPRTPATSSPNLPARPGFPRSLVRRIAAMSAGRIGDPPGDAARGAAAHRPRFHGAGRPRRSRSACWADTAAVQPLIERLTGLPALEPATAVEAITALAKIGGPAAGEFFAGVLGGKAVLTQEDRSPGHPRDHAPVVAAGRDAPVTSLLPFMDDTNPAVRWRAVYALGRLRAPAAAERCCSRCAIRTVHPLHRGPVLSPAATPRPPLSPATVARSPRPAASDANPQVRTNALAGARRHTTTPRSLPRIEPQLDDPIPNVQVAAAQAIGGLGGSEAARDWSARLRTEGTVRGAARGARRPRHGDPERSPAHPRRMAEERRLAGAGRGGRGDRARDPGPAPWFLSDRDGRVVAAGLQAWAAADTAADPAILAAARRLLGHADAGVRSRRRRHRDPRRPIRPTSRR